jgi:hypothetical protein
MVRLDKVTNPAQNLQYSIPNIRSLNQHLQLSMSYGSAFSPSPTFITTPFLHISRTIYKESSSGSSSTSIRETKLGWLSFFMIAISSLIKYKELPCSFPSLISDAECRYKGALKPLLPALKCPGRLTPCGLRRMLDWARFRSRDLENSLTAYDSAINN